MRCAVLGCNSNNVSKKYMNKTMNFFRFPKNPDISEKWINACSRADNINVHNARICHLHFNKEKDFVRCLREELLEYKIKSRRKLKDGAVPTLMLKNNVSGQKASTIYTLVKSNDNVSGRGEFKIEERILLENDNDSLYNTKKNRIKTKIPAMKPVIITNLKNISLLGKQLKVLGGTNNNNIKEKTINIVVQKPLTNNESSGFKIEKSANNVLIITRRDNTGLLESQLNVEGANNNNSEKTLDNESILGKSLTTNRTIIDNSSNNPVIITNIENTGYSHDNNSIKNVENSLITKSSTEFNSQSPLENHVIEDSVETSSNGIKAGSSSDNVNIEKAVYVENISQRLIITSRCIGSNTEGSSDCYKVIEELKQKIVALEWQSKGLNSIFSPAQIKRINEPFKRPRWSEEDICDSIVLFANGPKVYKLLLEKGYPLPAINTLRIWMKNDNIRNLYLKTKMHTGILKKDKTVSKKIKKMIF